MIRIYVKKLRYSIRKKLVSRKAKWIFSIIITGIVLGIIGLRIAYYLDLQTYHTALPSDGGYYYAIGKSLYENGQIQDITRYPSNPPANAHIGISFVYAGLYGIFEQAEDVAKHSAWLGLIGFVVSVFFLFLIARQINLSHLSLFLLAVYLAIHPLYFYLAMRGHTEAFFFPMVMAWLFVVVRWWKRKFKIDATSLLLLLLASFFTYAFRLQALILFLALLLTLLVQRKYIATTAYGVISAISVGMVLLINQLLGGTGMGRGESKHFGFIRDFSLERVIDFTPTVSQLLYEYDRFPWLSGLFLIILLVVIAHLIYLAFKSRNSLIILSSLISLGSLSALFLFRHSIHPGHLRYILYILPILFIFYLYGLKYEYEPIRINLPKYFLTIGVVLLALLTLRHETVDWQVREFGPREHHDRNAERFYALRNIHQQEHPDANRYANINHTSPEAIRVLFAATDQPSYTNYTLEELPPNSLTVIRKENNLRKVLLKHNPEADLIYEYRINNHYEVYYIP